MLRYGQKVGFLFQYWHMINWRNDDRKTGGRRPTDAQPRINEFDLTWFYWSMHWQLSPLNLISLTLSIIDLLVTHKQFLMGYLFLTILFWLLLTILFMHKFFACIFLHLDSLTFTRCLKTHSNGSRTRSCIVFSKYLGKHIRPWIYWIIVLFNKWY